MKRLLVPMIVLLAAACSDRSTLEQEKSEEGQIGASSGPNANYDGASTGDAFQAPTPPEQAGEDGGAADDPNQPGPAQSTP